MNKKISYLIILLVIVLIGGYFVFSGDKGVENLPESSNTTIHSDSEFGFEFSYRTGPDGYVLEEVRPTDLGTNFIKALILFRTEDTEREMPVGGEGPPVMAVAVFDNPERQSPQVWADTNVQYSTINLKIGDVSETTVGGASAIRYMADGLYVSENLIVANGEHIYIITGQFLDQDSDIRRDFSPLVQSIRFSS